ncbi:MAG TPA: hypothetical protein VFJ66_07530, partial [Gaiellales bacterium]|nr:hypothetical protein [Gaiellales bacterium]
LLWSTVGVVAVAVILPFTPLADPLGFMRLPPGVLAAIAALVPAYLLLLELGKLLFFRAERRRAAYPAAPGARAERRILRRASRWTVRRRPHPAR